MSVQNNHVRATCNVCLESNLILLEATQTEKAKVLNCYLHSPFIETPAVAAFRAAVDIRVAHNKTLLKSEFNLARFLTLFDTEHPCQRTYLENQFCQTDSKNAERHIKSLIENLRRDWLLPIGSHKQPPYGYYFITEEKDFIRWQRENLSSALTQIKTNYRVFKHNFRHIAGQETFDFGETIEQQILELMEAAEC